MLHFHFLHGFLGLPIDWGPLILELKAKMGDNAPQFHMHNLWKDMQNLPEPSLKNWALQFVQKLPPSGNVLIGFSMGGRLAMHFPVWEQRKLSGIVLISAHPGLIRDEERQQRGAEDNVWADKFTNTPWELVVREWNSQAIFAHDRIRPPRRETDFSRLLLVKALTHWSLSRQENMAERLKEFHCPIYYFYGVEDEKFSSVASSLKLRLPSVHLKPVPGGHCPHFSHPGELVRVMPAFQLGLIR